MLQLAGDLGREVAFGQPSPVHRAPGSHNAHAVAPQTPKYGLVGDTYHHANQELVTAGPTIGL